MTLSFKDYAKKLEALGENVPAIFKQVAGRGAVHFRNEAVEQTDKAGAVDTGAYKRSWNAEVIELGNNEYGIVCMNSMEYASFLEDGYEITKKHFVPFDKMEGSPKTQSLISLFKAKYPNAKGFIAKPRRFKGLKIGRKTMNDLEGWALLELQNEIDVAMTSQKFNISKKEARSYIKEANK